MKVFATIKTKMKHIRNDYYSEKTFNALKNTPEKELRKATKIADSIIK